MRQAGRRTAAAGSWSRVKSHDGEDSVEQRIAAVQGTGDGRQTGLKARTMERGSGSQSVRRLPFANLTRHQPLASRYRGPPARSFSLAPCGEETMLSA